MPRILRILNRLIIGGPALNATYLTRYMAPDYETMLVIGGKDDHEQDASHLTQGLGIEPVVVPEMKRAISPSQDTAAYHRVKKLIKDFKPDIVHTHAAKSGAIGRLAAHACKVPVIVHTFHGHVFHSYFGKVKTTAFLQAERYLARRSSGIIAISEQQKQELTEIYRICPSGKMRIIPLGLDLDKFSIRQDEKRAAFRKIYNITDEEIVIGIIGRIVPVKNHALFVSACAILCKNTRKKVRILIIGDGDMRGEMEKGFASAGISYTYWPEHQEYATATCISWQTEMDEVLAGLDIVALTSHNEGTPVSLIEAQAALRPLVSTDVGGVRDAVLQEQSGIITPAGDAPAFAGALLRLVEDEALRKSFGKVGLQHVAKRYSYHRLVSDMKGYYEELLEKRK